MIPKEFDERMKKMLPEKDYDAFLKSYDKPRFQSLRFNPLKGDKASFLQENPFHLQPVPWEQNGFYYEKEDTPGKHPYHEAGVYYIQEPSAMAPAAYLEAQPGERVLDLCGAPGGKSTQIAASMQEYRGASEICVFSINRNLYCKARRSIEQLGRTDRERLLLNVI